MSKALKPHLACDYDEAKLVFPTMVMCKIDGVRGINLDGNFTGRSLKAFKNPYMHQRFGGEWTLGFDGEIVLGDWTDTRLCSRTTGFCNRKTARHGKPTESDEVSWYIFDYLAPHVIDKSYAERLMAAQTAVDALNEDGIYWVKMVPSKLVYSLEELLEFEAWCLEQGFEGVIIRDPNGMHKSGRATTRLGAYMRIKRFIDFEGIVVNIVEAMENTNEAKTNELGRSERSTHQANMVPKGMVGMIQMSLLADVEHDGKVVMKRDQLIDVGPGSMLHEERVFYFEHPEKLVGQIGKAKFFPKGQKDKLRFCTWVSLRAAEDMSE